jgi:prepilin-type N-terminal cleavage/methylation domain-containing protein
MHKRKYVDYGFTIVELLVTIVIIGIIASISIISYTGISQQAVSASMKADLSNTIKQLELFKATNGIYPDSIDDCPSPASNNICTSPSGSNTFAEYQANNSIFPPVFNLTSTNGSISYGVSSSSEISSIAAYRKSLTIDHTKIGSGGVANFPVLVDLSDLGSDFFSNVKTDGGDIRITKADGTTRLPTDLVSINKVGETGELWFKADTISDSIDTVFYIQYGNTTANLPAKNSTYGAETVWNNYDLVAHMQDGIQDSSSSDYSFTINGTNSTLTTDRLGKSNSAYALDNIDSEYKIRADNSPNIGEVGDHTYTAWISPATLVSSTYIYDHYNWRFYTNNASGATAFAVGRMTNSTGPAFSVGSSTTNLATSNWYLLTGVYHPDPIGGNGYIKYYINGVLQNTTSTSNLEIWIDYGNTNLQWGNSHHGAAIPFEGKVDDSTVYSGIRSDAFILTCYNNQSSPSAFYSLGAQEG